MIFTRRIIAGVIAAGIMLVSAAPAEARFLRLDTAKRLTYRVGVKLAPKVQADTWEVENKCDREDAQHITCYLVMHDTQTLGGKQCRWDVLVTASPRVTRAQSEFQACAA